MVNSLDAASIFGDTVKSNTTLQSSVDELLKSISSVEDMVGEYKDDQKDEKQKMEAHVSNVGIHAQSP
jgi:hypothetical protein